MKKRTAIDSLLVLFMGLTTFTTVGQTAPQIDWLNQQLFPIHSTKPDQAPDDLQPFLDMVKQARLVGLGECTHGSREIFQMKHRLLKALVEQLDFSVFALEADFAGAQIVNQYVQTGQGDSLTVLNALGYWTWNTQEVWQMIQWIRAYNQDHSRKVVFAGFDMNVPFPAINAIRQYAVKEEKIELKRWVDELDTAWRRPPQKDHAGMRQLRQLSYKVYQQLHQRNASPTLQQSARTLVQYATMKGKWPYIGNMFRDNCMAINVDWLLKQYPGAKLVLWAHNGHMEKRGSLSRSMGYHLHKTYGPNYMSLGFATGRGTYTAFRMDSLSHTGHLSRRNPLVAPVAGSFEQWFEKAGVPNFYLDLRSLSSKSNEGSWLTQKKGMRNLGSVASDKATYQFRPNHRLTTLHDMVLYLNETSASRCYLAR